MKHELSQRFEEVFQNKPDAIYFAPGRINLIGEHIDYHGGSVLPAAISLGTYALIRQRGDKQIHFYSENFEEQGVYRFKLPIRTYDEKDDWTNYPKAVLYLLQQIKSLKYGYDIFYYGTIPNRSGLSSSASIEVLTAWMINDLENYGLNRVEIAQLSQQAENEYVGVNCGIMDQFAVALGEKDKAIYLNTDTLDYSSIPAKFEQVSILIMNSNRKRGLEDSDYNLRRKESEQAFSLLKEKYHIQNLIEMKLEDLEKEKELLGSLYPRVRHVVSENLRTLKAIDALKNNDFEIFGQCLNASHASLKHDYEVSSHELDTLVETAQKINGVYGARLTGAGFGGCAIALVDNHKIESVIKEVSKTYAQNTDYETDIYVAEIVDGVKKID